MKCTQFYPVLMTGQVADTARFFIDHLRFKALFESDWYVHLQSSEDDTVNLAVLQKDHDTVPRAARGASAGGVLLNFEVADVDAEYARAQQTGLKIVLPLRDEDFGQRHFHRARAGGRADRRHHAHRAQRGVQGAVPGRRWVILN